MEYNKDFNYDEFAEFMRYISGVGQAIEEAQHARTLKELAMMDELEVEISSRPCYSSVEDMLEAIRGM